MFAFSVLIGVYSWIIFFLGISGVLTSGLALSVFFLLIASLFFVIKRNIPMFSKPEGVSRIIFAALLLMAVVNFIGALGPELGFDALWYHLTLPKIWLSEHVIRFLPGSVFRYSVMPKLTETLYAASVALGSAIPAKLIHFTFGLLTLVPLYQISRRYLSRALSALVLLVFYSNLVVGWQSITAYVDLARTFFEILAFRFFLEEKYTKSAVVLGLAVSTKMIALFSLPIFILLMLIRKVSFKKLLTFVFVSLIFPAPWLIHAFIATGNPLYPVFSPAYENIPFSFNPVNLWSLFTSSPDPVSPLYIILFPLLFFIGKNFWSRGVRLIFFYCLFSLIFWLVLPATGGSRFILPYLPVFSLAAIIIFNNIRDKFIRKIIVAVIIISYVSSLGYRAAANFKYLPVITRTQSVQDFLTKHLDFSSGNFSDTDGFLSENISSGKTVLVSGINNLFYADFKFIHEQYYSGEKIDYLLMRYPDSLEIVNQTEFGEIYHNPLTRVRLFEKL